MRPRRAACTGILARMAAKDSLGRRGEQLAASYLEGYGYTIVDQRRKNLLKRLVATPMSRAEYLMAFVISRLGLLVAEVALVLGFAVLVAQVLGVDLPLGRQGRGHS